MDVIIEYLYCFIYVSSITYCVYKYLDRKVKWYELALFLLVYAFIDYIMTMSILVDFGNQIISALLVLLSDYILICFLNKKVSFHLLFYTSFFNTLYVFIIIMITYCLEYIQNFNVIQTFSASLLRFVLVALFHGLSILSFKYFENRKLIPNKDITKNNCFLLCLINIVIQFVFNIFQWMTIKEITNSYIHIILLAFTLIWLILLYSLNKTFLLNEQREKDILTQSIYQNIEQYVQKYKSDEEKTRKMKHDMKNHFIIMNNLDDSQKIKEYIRHIFSELDKIEISSQSVSGNLYVDAILNTKRQEYPNVQVSYDLHINDLVMNSFDLSTLLFNLVDNAFYAANHIYGKASLKMIYDCCHLIIEINNDCEKKSTLVSSIGEGHGYGLKIIKEIVHKYNGKIEYQLLESTMTVKISLKV